MNMYHSTYNYNIQCTTSTMYVSYSIFYFCLLRTPDSPGSRDDAGMRGDSREGEEAARYYRIDTPYNNYKNIRQ